uniref:Uncharacterized protein n=1 Tax=Saccharolobus islandicus TaxID=43080 RepID=Q9P9K2_SACIS|nr:hypothetical protein [Sulfolobus islandicus]
MAFFKYSYKENLNLANAFSLHRTVYVFYLYTFCIFFMQQAVKILIFSKSRFLAPTVLTLVKSHVFVAK